MDPRWSDSRPAIHKVRAAVTSLAMAALAGCGQAPSQSASPANDVMVPPTAVATGTSAVPSASGEVDFFLNVGGGLVHQPGGLIDIIANNAEVKDRLLEVAPDEGFVLTANAPIGCPGILKDPTLRLSTSEGLAATTSIDGVGVAIFDRTVPNFIQLVGDLCDGTTAEAKVLMAWDCDGVAQADREIGRLLCGQVDVIGKDDPTGVIDGPLTNCPPLPGVQMTLIRVNGMTTAGPTCAAAKPDSGWQWSKNPPAEAAASTAAAAGSLDPQVNPEFTDVNGVYGWIAPFDACYFVKAVHSSCTWFSSVFFVAKGTPVTELNFRRLDVPLVCDFTTVPCP